MSTKTDWWFRFFNSPDYLSIYKEMTGPKRTEKELDFCSKALRWKKGQQILDAPCGAGRHSIELAKRGFSVTGLDVSYYLLGKAEQQSQLLPSRIPTPVFTRGLLQQCPFLSHTFDYVICMFSSFGYGETQEENLTIMKEFTRILKNGGKVLIDLMNRNFIEPRLNCVYESEQEGLFVREERTIIDNGRRLNNLLTVTDRHGNKRSYLYRPWLFNGWEISLLATQAGLNVETVYGNFNGSKFSNYSERAMLVAYK